MTDPAHSYYRQEKKRLRDNRTKDAARPLYHLGLHDEMNAGGLVIMRVPGGWLYTSIRGSSFVPYHNEFYAKEYQDEDPTQSKDDQ
jgi:hypothetical protein